MSIAVRFTLMLAVATSCMGRAAIEAQESIPFRNRLPENTQLFFRVPSMELVKSRMRDSSMGRMMDDDNFAEVREQLGRAYEVLAAELDQSMKIDIEKLLAAPSGEIGLAAFPDRNNGVGFITLMEIGEETDTVESLLDVMASSLERDGAKLSNADVADVSFKTIQQGPRMALVYGFHDGFLLVGNSVAAVEAVLTRWDGQSDRTFESNEIQAYIQKRCQSSNDSPLLEYFVDPVGLLSASMVDSGEPNLQMQMLLGFLPTLGINKIRALGGTFDMGTEQFDSVSRQFIYIDPPVTGVLSVLQFPAINQEPPEWIPATAYTYMGFNWNIAEGYPAIETLFDTFQGAGALSRILDQIAEQPNGPKFHVKDDFVDRITGRVHYFYDAPVEDEPDRFRFCLGFELRGSDRGMQSVLKRFSEYPGFPGKIREFRGVNIFEVESADVLGSNIGAVATQGHLFIASDVELIDQIIRGSGAGLKDDPNWQRAREHFSESSIVGFQKSDPQLRFGYESMRTMPVEDLLIAGDFPDSDAVSELDFSKLPPFEKFEKYLTPSTFVLSPDEQGVQILQFSLKLED